MGERKLAAGGEEAQVHHLALRQIEVLPESFQTRAKLDMAVVDAFTRTINKGMAAAFPPALVARTPDGRLILADGFHRHKGHEKARPKPPTIRAIVVDVASPDDALLLGIAANLDANTFRKPDEDDRKHAVEMMLRNEEFRTWSDNEIGRRCGTGPHVVAKIRLRLSRDEGIAIPDRIRVLDKQGRWCGEWRNYRKARTTGIPALTPNRKSAGTIAWVSYFDGHYRSYGGNEEEARRRFARDVEAKVEAANCLKDGASFVRWLGHRGIHSECLQNYINKHLSISCVVIVPGAWLVLVSDFDRDSLLCAIGKVFLLREHPDHLPIVVVGYYRSAPGRQASLIEIARSARDPIEFLTPEEVVERFAPRPDAPDADAPKEDRP